MARHQRKYRQISSNYRRLPITQRSLIPPNDTAVLKHNPPPPLEHGGVYEEMGADFTYEEMMAHDHAPQVITDYDEEEYKVTRTKLYLGVLALLMSVAALFVWPFWTGLAAFVLSVASFSQGTKAISWLSGTLAVIAMASSIISYLIYV